MMNEPVRIETEGFNKHKDYRCKLKSCFKYNLCPKKQCEWMLTETISYEQVGEWNKK